MFFKGGEAGIVVFRQPARGVPPSALGVLLMSDVLPELVFAPTATIIACSDLKPEALARWAGEVDCCDVLTDKTTPLATLSRAAAEGRGLEALPEFAGRFCYRSFRKGRSSEEYLDHILESGHGSVLEHVNVSFALAGISRALTHELIRHRVGTAVSQESQRYVDAKDVRFVVPPLLAEQINDLEANGDSEAALSLTERFRSDCRMAQDAYIAWQALFREQLSTLTCMDVTTARKRANEAARALLPNATETRMVWTMNMRAARHVVELRGHRDADLEIRRLSVLMAGRLKEAAPMIFDDMEIYQDEDGFDSVRTAYRKV